MKLKGKIALITGAAGGIGSAVARVFAAEGAHLALLDANAVGLEALTATLREEGATVQVAVTDLSTEDGVSVGINAVLAPYNQHVDILVANVGQLIAGPSSTMTAADWQQAFAINCFSHVYACSCIVPLMKAQGSGCIVFVTSDQSGQPDAEMAPYGPAKAATQNYAHILTRELAPTICVHCAAPGMTRTPMVEQRLMPQLAAKYHTDAEQAMALELERRAIPLGRLLEPREVAKGILYLAQSGPATTGITLNISGGNVKSVVC